MRQIQYVVKATIRPGESNTSENFKLPMGFTTGEALYTNGVEKTINGMASIEMKDDNSISIVPAVHIDTWRHSNGGECAKSFPPRNFDPGNKRYSLILALGDPLAGNSPFHLPGACSTQLSSQTV